MRKQRRERTVLAVTGAAAIVAVGLNLLFSFISARRRNSKKPALPGSSVLLNLSASEISNLADCIITKSKETYDRVASSPLQKVCYENVVCPLAELEAEQFPLIQSCFLQRIVSSSIEVQNASLEAERRLDSHFSFSRKREDLYRVIKALLDKDEKLQPEAKRYLQCLVSESERNGVRLPPSKKNEMERIKSQIDELSVSYIQNLNDSSKFILLTEQELAGMPLEFLEELEKKDGKLKVTLTTYHVTPILEICKVGSTRKLVATSYSQRGGNENLLIIQKLAELRRKFSQLLGYSSYSDFALEPRMASSSSKVLEFLQEISESLDGLAERELDLLKDLKRRAEGNSPFEMQDLLYYMKRVEGYEIDFDLGDAKEYFPVDIVLSGIMKTLQNLFGLRFEQVKDAEVWHDSVTLFSVYDCNTSDLLGYFYLDIFSREGKYAHSCVLPLQNGCSTSSGTRKVATSLLLSQFPKEINGDSALLGFPDVVSLFHEFTHVVHHICNKATFCRFAGFWPEGDFAEMPSLLLENWCYESTSLKLMSGFHQDVTKSIASEMCNSLKTKRDLFAGLKLKQEILLCLIDQIVHSSENVDIVNLAKDLHPKVMMGIPLLEGTNPLSSFARIAVGYEAVCYNYIWNQVLAADIFATKFEDDLLNHHAGLHFRNKVLAPGAEKDPLEIITEYLGREPSFRCFIESKTRSSF
ncbi:hypothetical protein LUZ60_002180 [Juncus effusus]|nr:hypothetical protein LUZ60_002180 [Juncus effusus]